MIILIIIYYLIYNLINYPCYMNRLIVHVASTSNWASVYVRFL